MTKRIIDHAVLIDRIKALRADERRSLRGIARRIAGVEYDAAYDHIVLPGYVVIDDHGYAETFPHATSPEDAAQRYVEGGSWSIGSESIAIEVNVGQRIVVIDDEGDIVADVADWQCELGIVHPDEPSCAATEDGAHQWSRDHALVGGIAENPGTYAVGGCAIQTIRVCVHCGTAHHEVSNSQGENTLYDHDREYYIDEYVSEEALKRYRSER